MKGLDNIRVLVLVEGLLGLLRVVLLLLKLSAKLVVTPVVHELAAVAEATDAGLSVIFAAHWILIPSHCGSNIGGSPEETRIEMLVQVL